jgi:RND family efflux transporter MFP subunit
MKVLVASVCAALLPALAQAEGFECLIEASQTVEIRPAVDGVIARVHVRRGDVARKGQPLVELQSAVERLAVDSARYRAQMQGQISAARNRLDYAARKLARATDLQQQNYASAQARDDAEAERRLAESELQAAVENRELAQIEVRRAVEQLALRTIASPFDGVVVDRMLNPGDLAESGSGRKPVLKLAQIDPMRVDIVLPASAFGQVRPGTKASIVPKGLNTRYVGSVVLVDRLIDSASSTFVARLELPNPKQSVAGGMRCTAEIDGIAPPPREAARARL